MTDIFLPHWQARCDLAAAFRLTVRHNLHEAVSNHFSFAVNADGTEFLINPNQKHFSLVCASDLLLLDAQDKDVLARPDAPDATAWGLHSAIHRAHPHARCIMHTHSMFATVLASLTDSVMPPIDLNTATFFGRHVVDTEIEGLAYQSEGERCAGMLNDPKTKVLVLGNHGILVLGETIAETFNRMYYFERAAETYIRALQTGKPLRVLSDKVAENIARDLDNYPGQAERHFTDLKILLGQDLSGQNGNHYAT